MSDERFDQDLRSVLVEAAPREVPADLRRRVAAVSVSDPAPRPAPRLAWLRAAQRTLGAVAAIVVLIVVVTVGFGLGTQPGGGGHPAGLTDGSPSPSAAPSRACVAADLAARITAWQGAAGSRIADVEITNTADDACFVSATVALQLVDQGGRVLIDSKTVDASEPPSVTRTASVPVATATATPAPDLALEPGDTLRTQVAASDYCGPAASPPIGIVLVLPAAGGSVAAVPADGVSSSDAVPPCLGITGGHIAMNGWRR